MSTTGNTTYQYYYTTTNIDYSANVTPQYYYSTVNTSFLPAPIIKEIGSYIRYGNSIYKILKNKYGYYYIKGIITGFEYHVEDMYINCFSIKIDNDNWLRLLYG